MASAACICIVTGSHLCRNPRVVKEADALADAGYDVTVVGPVFSDELRSEDEELRSDADWTHRTSVDLRRTVSGTWARLRRKAGSWLTRRGWATAYALGYGVNQTLRRARQEAADLYIGHEEVGTWVVWKLEQEGGRIGVDFEDWHARDLQPEDRRDRPVALLETVERDLLHRAVHATTMSKAMAEAMADAYDAPEPLVLYNAFPWADRESIDGDTHDRDGTGRVSVHWVSQTIGPGRGLGVLCRALREIETPLQVHLRGQCRMGYRAQLDEAFPAENGHTLFVHDPVSPGDLLSRIAEHDIGLALEPAEPDNKRYTISNKILHFLLGGLAVIATDTSGQSEVARLAGAAVELCSPNDAEELARKILNVVCSEHRLDYARAEAQRAARDTFCWEKQAPRLLASVQEAVRSQ